MSNSAANIVRTGSHVTQMAQTRQNFFSGSTANGSALPPKAENFVATPSPPSNISYSTTKYSANGADSTDRKRSPSPFLSRPISTASTQQQNVKETIIQGYVGFANMPNQVYRKAIKRGFDFTLMVVGPSKIGKSTFINSLFLSDIYDLSNNSPLNRQIPKTVQIEETTVTMKENGVCLNLTLIDTPGFGDAIDNTRCWDPIAQHIDKKYAEYFAEETKIARPNFIPDKRVHCCLYFIPSTNLGLKPLDIEVMKNLHERVNLIPVIAKADSLTSEECQFMKKRIIEEIRQNQIRIYEFPDAEDEDENRDQKRFKNRLPFAIVGSTQFMDVGGKRIRCRKFPWGIVEVENLEHTDFAALREMLIRTHMIDLVDVTRNVHYENFRCRQLMSVSDMESVDMAKDPFTQMEEEKTKHAQKLKKQELDMENVFQAKLREKLAKLRETESECDKRAEQMLERVEAKKRELEEAKQKFLSEKQMYEKQYPDFHRYTSTESLGKDKDKKKKGIFSAS